MRTYSGFWGKQRDSGPGPGGIRGPRAQILSLMAVVLVFFFVMNFGNREGAGSGVIEGAIRFYYVVAGDSRYLDYVDITIAFTGEHDLINSLERWFASPPAGRLFAPSIGTGVTISALITFDRTVQIDFNTYPFAHLSGEAESYMAANAVAWTLLDLYDSNTAIITVEGDVIAVVER